MSNVGKRGKLKLETRLRAAMLNGTNTRLEHHEIERVIQALSKPQTREEAQPVPFVVGNQYRTQGGDMVRFVSVHRAGTSCETMADEDGVHRYTMRDFGRVTGTDHDYSDPRNTPPLYTHPAPDALRVAVEALEKIKAVRVCKESANIWTGADACRKIATAALAALAALQAEQKGGA